MANVIPQKVAIVPNLATFQSSPVSGYQGSTCQLAYLQGEVTELDGGQGFYQARDNDYSTAVSYPDIIADSTGLRWQVTTAVTQAQIVSALTDGGTEPGLDPLSAVSANIAAATTTDLSTATGNYVNITGSGATITGLGTLTAGRYRFCVFAGANTLTNNATSLILPGGANITTAAGDFALFVSLGSGNWKCLVYQEAAGGTVGTLPVNQGGTGVATITNHGVMLGQGISPIVATSVGATGTVLRGATGADPAFGAVVLTTDVSGILPVANGGTGLASGTSGGIPAYTASGTIASSAALAANQLVLGGGAGVVPATLGSLGTTTTVLHGNAAGAPTFGAVSLTADVSGILPLANGGTGVAVPPLLVGGRLNGANMNSTADQAIAISLPTGITRYRVQFILALNASTSLTTAVGGVYNTTGKGGTPLVAASQIYTALTGAAAGAAGSLLQLTADTGSGSAYQTATTLYLSLTTPQGGAATADFAVIIVPLA